VAPGQRAAFEGLLQASNIPHAAIGEVTLGDWLQISGSAADLLIDIPLAELKEAWQKPLRW
jgi:phosphoribosylformylglycinamidine synthase